MKFCCHQCESSLCYMRVNFSDAFKWACFQENYASAVDPILKKKYKINASSFGLYKSHSWMSHVLAESWATVTYHVVCTMYHIWNNVLCIMYGVSCIMYDIMYYVSCMYNLYTTQLSWHTVAGGTLLSMLHWHTLWGRVHRFTHLLIPTSSDSQTHAYTQTHTDIKTHIDTQKHSKTQWDKVKRLFCYVS